MGTQTRIEWTDHTFNPWRGCAKVSAGCDHCYAERMAKRNPTALGEWGQDGERVIASDAYWRQPRQWNKQAEKAGVRRKVFCGSMMDVFEDRKELRTGRAELLSLIDTTPWLDWLLLTKRPENIVRLWDQAATDFGDLSLLRTLNKAWLGASVENQAAADLRIPTLLKTPAFVRFLSCEPLLGPLDLRNICHQTEHDGYASFGNFWDINCENDCTWRGFEDELIPNPAQSDDDAERNGTRYVCPVCHSDSALIERDEETPAIHWVIAGSESGPRHRPCDLDWLRSLRDQCIAAGVPFFLKQAEMDGQLTKMPALDGHIWKDLPR